jgi:integrase
MNRRSFLQMAAITTAIGLPRAAFAATGHANSTVNNLRQIVLSTETTGLDAMQGDRIVELACVELINSKRSGRIFYQCINPERDVSDGAVAVHGLKQELLGDEPKFAEIAPALLEFISDAELITHHAIIATGKVATAVELSKDIGQMLRWAEKRKPWRALLIDCNPDELVEIEKLVPANYTKERTRQLSIEEICKLKQIFDESESIYADAENKRTSERPLKKEAQIALWLCLGTICRIGELLMTEWKHVNLEQRTWFIPAENTKGERGRKCTQLIYLSDFTFDQFKQLHALTGDSKWAFPARFKEGHVCVKTVSKQVGDRQVKFKSRTRKLKCRAENNNLVVGDEEWTPHDLRRTGATLMQKLKISREVINLCQNHVIGSKVDRVYLLDDYADEKRDAWNKLGDRLEAILSASNVVSLKSA